MRLLLKHCVQVIEVNASEVRIEFTAGQGGQTQRGFLIRSEGIETTTDVADTGNS